MIDYYTNELRLSKYCSRKEFYKNFNRLDLDKQNLIQHVLERIYFDKLIYNIEDRSLIEKFKWNLRLYLLLSSSDALGSGCNYYSFEGNYLSKKRLEERDKIIDKIVNDKSITREKVLDKIQELYDNYKSHQTVRQSFHNFWNNRSQIIKEKLMKCFYCFADDSNLDYKILIDKYFYILFRNDFTHSAKTNLPALPDLDKKIRYNKYSDNGIYIAEVYYENKILNFNTPITKVEKEMLIENKVKLLAKRLYNDEIKEVSIDSIDFMINLNFGFSYLTMINEKEYAINASIIETIKEALIEGIFDLLNIEIDWKNFYKKKYFA